MLKGIDQRLTADVVHALMQMGHGDDVLICDINHPATSIAADTVRGRPLDLGGCDIPTALRAILPLFPVDDFVDAPVSRMQIVGNPEGTLPLFDTVQDILNKAENRIVTVQPLERFAFYDRARKAFCVIRTSDSGPYGCFILKKGVVTLPPLG